MKTLCIGWSCSRLFTFQLLRAAPHIHPTQLLLVASACITVPLIYMPGIGKGGSWFHGVPLGEHGCSNKLGVHAYMGLVLPICLIILQSMSGMGPANYVK